MNSDYLIVSKKILPDYYEKVLEARRLLDSGAAEDVSSAVRQAGISRSTYYKYKDFIFEPGETASGRNAVFLMLLNHEPGVLSNLLSLFSSSGANILTISQSPPIHEKASVTITADVDHLACDVSELMTRAISISGVEQTRLIAME